MILPCPLATQPDIQHVKSRCHQHVHSLSAIWGYWTSLHGRMLGASIGPWRLTTFKAWLMWALCGLCVGSVWALCGLCVGSHKQRQLIWDSQLLGKNLLFQETTCHRNVVRASNSLTIKTPPTSLLLSSANSMFRRLWGHILCQSYACD